MARLFVRVIALFALLAPAVHAAELRVAAASSLTDAMREISTQYEKATGTRVHLQLGASSMLARQISEGAPVDVFFSADERQMELLATRGLVVEATRHSVVTNELVVITSRDERALRTIRELLAPRFERIAVASFDAVPAGVYAREYLTRTGIWREILPRLVRVDNVRAALSAVENGNAQAAFVYASDALGSKNVRVALRISGPDAPRIVYPCAVLRESNSPVEATRFVTFLTSRRAQQIFAQHGFGRR